MAAKKVSEREFVLTISDSEEDIPDLDDETDNEEPSVADCKKSKKKKQDVASEDEATDLNKEFIFSMDDDNAHTSNFDGWDFASKEENGRKVRKDVDLDDIIRRRGGLGTLVGVEKESSSDVEEEVHSDDQDELAMDGFGMGNQPQAEKEEEEENAENENEGEEESGEEDEVIASEGESGEKPDQDTVEELAQFFEQEEKTDSQVHKTFSTLQLSRPVLKGLSALGYTTPSPIQSASIPIALLGKDIVAGAVTGSGKTAAYMIPIIERLLYKPSKVASSRVIVMTPTRELAIQVADVGRKLAQFVSGISFGLAVGGLNLRQQEAQLKTRPDIVIATPGRLIDHIRNSPSFSVDAVEVLVVDEADRMLEEGFQQELTEILSLIPQKRQTLLFSATMNSRIKDLIQLSLKRPVRIMINPPKQAASGLIQEFVRIRKRDALKPALLYSVLTKIDAKQENRTVVFVATKETAHRLRVILGLLGLKVSELHGSLSQEQRLKNVTDFKNLTVPILICTDLASRGLDIPKIEVVMNYDMPKSHEIYLHRVGRTARAGREGRSITFVGESSAERAIVKEAIKSIESSKGLNKHFKGKAVGRNVDWTQVEQFNKVISEKESLIEDVLNEEQEEKEILIAEMQLNKGENLLRHKDEIRSRPKRTWFQSEGEKKAEKQKVKKLNSKQRKVREAREEGGKVYSKTKADRDNDKHRSYTKQKAKAKMKKQKNSRK